MSLRQIMMAAQLPYKRRLSYLRGTGTQYIDTGILPDQDTIIEVKFRMTAIVSGAMRIFGANDEGICAIQGVKYANFNKFDFFPGGGKAGSYQATIDTNDHVVRISNNAVVYDGVSHSFSGATSWQVPRSIWLWYWNTNAAQVADPFRGAFYYCKILQGSTLAQDLKSVLWAANKPYVDGNTGATVTPTADKPGMYDAVTKRLFVNQASGNDFEYE